MGFVDKENKAYTTGTFLDIQLMGLGITFALDIKAFRYNDWACYHILHTPFLMKNNHNIFTIFLQQILSDRLLLVVIIRAKK